MDHKAIHPNAACFTLIPIQSLLVSEESLPLPWAIALLLLAALPCRSIPLFENAPSLFPDHLVGRGETSVTLAQTLSSAALTA
jgi:hypothetical protein